MSDYSQGPGWWQASDGRWYPPEGTAGGAPRPPPPYGQPYGAPAAQPWKPTAALVLGIVSVVPFLNICFAPGILAIVFGSADRSYDTKAQAGFILGIIGTALGVLFTILFFSNR
jgi:hypothetical protein